MADEVKEPSEVVSAQGLKPLFRNYVMLGIISANDLKSDDYDRLHAMVTNDVMKLVHRMKETSTKVCAVLNFDGNPVTSMVQTLLRSNRIPVQFLTSVAPTLANNNNIWYTDNMRRTFLESCTLVLNYGNEELTDYMDEKDVENVDLIERKLRPQESEDMKLVKEHDPYGDFWSQVKNKLRIQRMAYQGIRINQIIDLRPPNIP